MLATCIGFLLNIHNPAFKKASEINGFIWFVAILVSRQSVSWYSVLNVWFRCNAFILTSAKFLLWFSKDNWTFGYVLSSSGFKVETDVGINESFSPFWLLGPWTRYLIFAAWFDQWWIWWCYSSSVVAFEDFSRRNFSVEWFCLICCNISTKQPISCFACWRFRFGAIEFIVFS